jgi:hypothetical protein
MIPKLRGRCTICLRWGAEVYQDGEWVHKNKKCSSELRQRNDIQDRIYRGELEATDADGVTTMKDLQ